MIIRSVYRLVLILACICMLPPIYIFRSYLSYSKKEVHANILTHKDLSGNYERQTADVSSDESDETGISSNKRNVEEGATYKSFQLHAPNKTYSNDIPLERSIPDTRLEKCRYWSYPQDLPKASVIIVFHNEAWSTLLRTIYSVINRTPLQILEEIMLVDDFSNVTNLKADLENYLEKFKGKVRLIRNKKREGLIRAKSVGARNASGEVIVFLDSHCEVNVNWLPPLLEPIYRNRTTMTVPVIDVIDRNTFEYYSKNAPNQSFYGYFEWGLVYQEYELPVNFSKSRKNETEPYKTPIHSGESLAIDRKYFLSLAEYDPGLLMSGGENFDLSFKVWMCGGSILWVPCSRVGHVSTTQVPDDPETIMLQKSRGPILNVNLNRVVEVWFDSKFKQFFYTRDPLAWDFDFGEIVNQLALKEQLKCKSFQWYMDNIPYVPLTNQPRNKYWGGLRNIGSTTCVDSDETGIPRRLKMKTCFSYGYSQLLRLDYKGKLSLGEACVDGNATGVKLVSCPFNEIDGPWVYNDGAHTLRHRSHNKCMALHVPSHNISLLPCQLRNEFHQWIFEAIQPWWL